MTKSLQDILKRRQQEEFVGREEQLAFFRRNLDLAPENPSRRFIVNVSGQGGVGKTWLLRRFRQIAKESGAVTACTDEAEGDIPTVMGRLAEQFEAQGYELKTFVERYEVYRQRKKEIEADLEASQGLPAFVGRTLAKGGLHLARRAPGVGLAAEFVDEQAFADLGEEFASYVARKIKNKDMVRLLLEPVEVLTPLLLADLQKVAEEHPIALFFDTYERTGEFLDPWLRDLLEGRYGDVPADILLTIAGRDELDRNYWSPYEGALTRSPLDPFTEEEARDYLARKGVTDEKVIDVILGLSGRLPLLVATLAAESPDDPDQVGDPSGEAVERFLSWVEDPEQRQVALDAALPRRLNRDVLAVVAGEEKAQQLFLWLKGMPFVEKRGDGWGYHDVVRTQMLRYKRQESPQGWTDLHELLARHYEELRDGLGLEADIGRKDETWQRYALEALYHHLCHAPQRQLTAALNGFVAALKAQSAFAQRWAELIEQAGRDNQNPRVQDWGERLVAGLKAWDATRYEEAAEMYTELVDYSGLERMWQAEALARRGGAYALMAHYEEALSDLNRALALDSNSVWAIAGRGLMYRDMGQLENALTDFNHALKLDPNLAWVIASRGTTYEKMKRYDDALADYDLAIALDFQESWVVRARGWTYWKMGHYEVALANFNQAIRLDSNDAEAIASRGSTYRAMGRYEEALVDLNHAIEMAPNLAWAIGGRGETYRQMRQYKKALADFDYAIELEPNLAWVYGGRAMTYCLMERYDEALIDSNQAIELEPDEDWHYFGRALVLLVVDQPDRARSDLAVAIQRSRQVCEDNPQDWRSTVNLARYHLAAGQVEEAKRLYRKTLSGDVSPYLIHKAVLDLHDFLALFPNHPEATAIRDMLQQYLEEIDE